MKHFMQAALSARITLNSVRIALVVGTILNGVNQGDALWSGIDISWGHIALNYLVPYCVATYSAVKNELSRKIP